MNEKPYTLVFMLKDHSVHESFAEAFKVFFRLIKEERIMSLQMLETACWIKHKDSHLPLMIYQCVEEAHQQGLLKDGVPTWE